MYVIYIDLLWYKITRLSSLSVLFIKPQTSLQSRKTFVGNCIDQVLDSLASLFGVAHEIKH